MCIVIGSYHDIIIPIITLLLCYGCPGLFGNGRHIAGVNTDTLCESGIIKELLRVLQWEGFDGHAQLTIIMCLSMLVEDRGES